MGKRILILDDDKELCEELSEILSEEGFSADFALSPLEGKELLQKKDYDMLILDYKMPGMNGIEFLKGIQEKIGELKVFIISGSLSIKKLIEENDLSQLVAGVLSKPFDVEMLLKELKR